MAGRLRINDRSVVNSATRSPEALLLDIHIDQHKQMLAKIMIFHQATTFEDCGFIQNKLVAKDNKITRGAGIVKRHFRTKVRQPEQVLKKTNLQRASPPTLQPFLINSLIAAFSSARSAYIRLSLAVSASISVPSFSSDAFKPRIWTSMNIMLATIRRTSSIHS